MTAHASSAGTRAGLVLFVGGAAGVGVAYASTMMQGAAPEWAPWLVAVGSSAASVGLFVLGAATRGTLSRPVSIFLGTLLVVLVASFAIALGMTPDEGSGGRLLLGLPVRLAVVFYGVGFLPLVALPFIHARTFKTSDTR